MGVIPVLVVFVVAAALCAAWTKSTLQHFREQQLREQRTQTQWLAEAGIRRGAARLAADSTFTGETWRIPAAELARPDDASVVIRIESAADDQGVDRIVAIAAYPADQPRVRITKIVNYNPPTEEPSP
jgi:type II secretory pathway component PulK